MPVLVKNNATTYLGTALNTGSTTLSVQSGDGSKFAAPVSPDYFPLTIIDNAGQVEIVNCTARSGDVLTIVRAREGTPARAFPVGSRVEQRLTAQVIQELQAASAQAQQTANAGYNLANTMLVGSMCFFANPSAPAGWLKCNGAGLNRANYPALFAAIGTLYGSTDSSNFFLPDTRGLFLRAVDDGRGVDVGRGIGSYQAMQNASHTHTATTDAQGLHGHNVTVNAVGDHAHAIGPLGNNNGYTAGVVAAGGSAGLQNGSTAGAGNHTHGAYTDNQGSHGHNITVAGSGGNESRPQNLAFPIYIKY